MKSKEYIENKLKELENLNKRVSRKIRKWKRWWTSLATHWNKKYWNLYFERYFKRLGGLNVYKR